MRTILATFLLIVLVTPALEADPLLPLGNSTIVSFGDSTTAPRGSLVVYSNILRTELPHYGIDATVINSGVGGNNTNEAMLRFQTDVRDHDPDLVIIQFGINDSMWNLWESPPATGPEVDLATYTANIATMTQTLKADGARVVLMTPNPMRWNDLLKSYYGAAPYDPNDPMGLNATITPYCQAVRDVATAQSVPLVDVYNLFVAYDQVAGQSMDNLLLDGMHPNDQAHQMIADALIGLIADGLPRDDDPGPPSSLPPKASLDFVHKYEANSGLPTVEDSGVGKTNWRQFAFTGHASVSGGVLSYSTMPEANSGNWFESSADAAGSAWLAEVDGATSYTIEFSAKITDSVGDMPGLHVFIDNGVNGAWLNVDTTRVAMGDGYGETVVLLEEIDNSSDFHVYRVAYDAENVVLQVWRDGARIGADVAPPKNTVYKVLGFGDGSSYGSGAGSIDYFRWDATGAFAPDVILALPGDANFDGVVNDTDASIVGAHWLATSATWMMGDFNDDGVVNDRDAAILAAHWGATGEASPTVPEPCAAVVLLTGVLAVGLDGRLRRRRSDSRHGRAR
jgi:lysophospholipase L1-like esterase